MGGEGEELLDLANRRRIYRRIQEAPGLHFRALQRDLDIALGTLEYNLYQLEREGIVVSREEAGFKSYYPNDTLDRRDRDILHFLRQRTSRRVALEIADKPGVSFQELRTKLGVLPSALSRQLKRLVSAGVVAEAPRGREKVYNCVEPERVRKLVVQYRATFLDQIVDRFAATWDES